MENFATRFLITITNQGIGYFLQRKIKQIRGNKIKGFRKVKPFFIGKSGLEIGGPSHLFTNKGKIPIYKILSGLDGTNFSNSTIWEGELNEKFNFNGNRHGKQFILDATNLSIIQDRTYDFVISSNCLEHVANPIKALKEWQRVVKSGGLVLVIVPNKKHCFDHKRATTTFEHLLDDYNQNIQEDDLTHLEEILEKHDYTLERNSMDRESFKERALKNFENRALHHHVFDIELLIKLFQYLSAQVLYTYEDDEFTILAKF